MKASTNTNAVPVFVPVTLTLTLETQEELDKIYFLFNCGYITEPLGFAFDGTSVDVRKALRPHGARTSGGGGIYETYRSAVEKKVRGI